MTDDGINPQRQFGIQNQFAGTLSMGCNMRGVVCHGHADKLAGGVVCMYPHNTVLGRKLFCTFCLFVFCWGSAGSRMHGLDSCREILIYVQWDLVS